MATPTEAPQRSGVPPGPAHRHVEGVHGVRYQVTDVGRAVAFYTTHLGFTVAEPPSPEFACVALGGVDILLSGKGASGSRPMPTGREQKPGGWNRVVIRVKDLSGFTDALRKAHVNFRNDIETCPAGRQVQIEDPDGNAVELFEPAP